MPDEKKPEEETRQIGYRTQPKEDQQDIMFTLRCGCGTYRTFIYNSNMARFVQRQDSGLALESVCHECGREMRMSLFWTTQRPGYSGRDPTDAYGGEVAMVVDNVGLLKAEE